jgi:Secretion system C-terminal sorting domain
MVSILIFIKQLKKAGSTMNYKKTVLYSTMLIVFQVMFLGKITFASYNSHRGVKKNSPEEITSESGLIFEKELDYKLDDSSYTDIIQLKDLSTQAIAIQFRLALNKAVDDSTLLIFNDIQKGDNVEDSSWVINYNVMKGPVLTNGASRDSVYVLLFNVNQNGGLLPGNYNSLLKVNYRVADLPELHDSVKSSMKISYAQASTPIGEPIDITPSRDQFDIKRRSTLPQPEKGLIFEKDSVYRLEDDSYTDKIQLKSLDAKLQALQFRLSVNKIVNDNLILTFEDIEKGSDVSDDSWVLTYNVFRGPLTGNGASEDSIYVLLYNLNQDGGLQPGDYDDLLNVKYRVSNLPALQDSIKSSLKISYAEATTYQGYPIDITPSRDNLTVIARNRIGFYGDVNGDGCLDILDLLLVVDHIIGKDSLTADEFERADIAPWLPGAPDPEPDGFVNVQDLSLLQNIILTGVYPSGVTVNGCSYTSLNKISGDKEADVTLYIYEQGITVNLNCNTEIRGAQFEFDNVNNDPKNMVIITDAGQGYYFHDNNTLSVLLYDRLGKKTFKPGEGVLADMPFNITTPEVITLEKIFLVDVNNEKITNGRVQIIYSNPPSVPVDYKLEQNYPNPFNPKTTIQYKIPVRSKIILKIYDILGNEVSVPVNEEQNRGVYNIVFNPVNFSSGVYFYRLQADPVEGEGRNFIGTKKMILLK